MRSYKYGSEWIKIQEQKTQNHYKLTYNNKIITGHIEIADAFNEHFSNAALKLTKHISPKIILIHTQNSLNTIIIRFSSIL